MRPKDNTTQTYDVIVIGGGPAGMMSAGTAGKYRAKTLLLEKNKILGKKLLITGGGRCNVLNGELDTRKLLSFFGNSSKHLFSPFSRFGAKDSFRFFHGRAMPTIEEENKRIFPESQKSESVLKVMEQYLSENKVDIRYNSEVKRIIHSKNKITEIVLKNGSKFRAKNYVMATGGNSRADTGSTGDGFIWAKDLGHDILEQNVALVPVATKERWSKTLSGMSFPNIKIEVKQNGITAQKKLGKVLFTHFGLSGPAVLTLSKNIGDLLEYGKVTVSLDFFPKMDLGDLDKYIMNILMQDSRKKVKNISIEGVDNRLLESLCNLAGIDSDTFSNSLTKEKRQKLVKMLKGSELTVTGLLGLDKAVVTSGGIQLKEIDTKTMSSRIIKNLFVTGDLLDIDRPTGGYSLQLCWTTGYVAGLSASKI